MKHVIANFARELKDEAYRIYVTDTLRSIAKDVINRCGLVVV